MPLITRHQRVKKNTKQAEKQGSKFYSTTPTCEVINHMQMHSTASEIPSFNFQNEDKKVKVGFPVISYVGCAFCAGGRLS